MKRTAIGIGAVVVMFASFGGALVNAGEASTAWRSALYREDAFAQFTIRDDACELARTDVQVSFHQDYFRSSDQPRTRSVVFGVAIQEFDCAGQFVVAAEGNQTNLRPFDIKGNLRRAHVDTTIETCVTFPAPGSCLPVAVDIHLDGIGLVDVDRDGNDIIEPDCRIHQRFVTKTRNARVAAHLAYTLPGQPTRTLHLDSSDLGQFGATLSISSERSYIRGSSGSCIEQ